MPIYSYQFLDADDNPLDEFTEIMQKITDEPLTIDPETNRKIKRLITAPAVRDGRPAWERCSDIADHIKRTRPKYVSDRDKGIRERFDPRNHG